MSRIKGLRRAFRLPWSTRSRVTREVDDELRFHLDMKAQELVAAGVPPDEALRLARTQFGDIDFTRSYMRRSDSHLMKKERRAELADELRQDIRFSLRQLRRSPAFTAVALICTVHGPAAGEASCTCSTLLRLSRVPPVADWPLAKTLPR